jgi:menaquinol-cytochrome c reductase iron-sulfur subunit
VDSQPDVVTRRRFLSRLSLGLSALAGAVVSVPIVAYLLSPLLEPSQQVWRDVGGADDFAIGTTNLVTFEEPSSLPWAGRTALTAAWLRRTAQQEFVGFAVNCTHLGCPVNWQPDAQLFLCPCHGGVYDADGSVAGGPPPHALFQVPTRLEDGRVQVQTRPLSFTQEPGRRLEAGQQGG